MLKSYDPSLVSVIAGGNPLSGWADGTFVNVSFDEDAYAKATGADGETVRVRSNNRGGSITITLLQSSLGNDVLSALALRGTAFPVLVKDLASGSIHSGLGWVKKPADAAYGKDVQNREWVIDCADLLHDVLGIQPDIGL